MSGWFPVPHDVAEHLAPSEWPVAFYLLQKANRLQYRPFRLESERKLSLRLDCSVRTIKGALEMLIEIGIIEVTVRRTGKRVEGRQVTVSAPKATKSESWTGSRNESRNGSRQHGLFADNDAGANHGLDHGADHGADHAIRDQEEDLEQEDLEQEDKTREPAPDLALSIWQHWKDQTVDGEAIHDTGTGSRNLRKADRRSIQARLKEDSEETIRLVLDWAHHAPGAHWWRENGKLSLMTLLRPNNWTEKVEKAEAWELSGRSDRPVNGQRASPDSFDQEMRAWFTEPDEDEIIDAEWEVGHGNESRNQTSVPVAPGRGVQASSRVEGPRDEA